MPAHHNLEAYLDAYIKAAGIGDQGKSPLFRSAVGRTDRLTEKPMNRVDAWRMVQLRVPPAPRPGDRRRIREPLLSDPERRSGRQGFKLMVIVT